MYLDSESIFINLDYDTSTSQIQQKLLEIHQLKDRVSFSREADFCDFGVDQFLQKSDAMYVHLRDHIMNL